MERLITSTNPEGYTYEDYVEYCEINGIQPGDESSLEFAEWQVDEARECFWDDIAEIKHYKPYNVPVVVTGRLGLWDGKHEIRPVEMDSVAAAIDGAFSHSTEDMAINYDDEGFIVIYAHHHDGTNCFEVRAKDGKLPNIWEEN